MKFAEYQAAKDARKPKRRSTKPRPRKVLPGRYYQVRILEDSQVWFDESEQEWLAVENCGGECFGVLVVGPADETAAEQKARVIDYVEEEYPVETRRVVVTQMRDPSNPFKFWTTQRTAPTSAATSEE